MREGPVFEVRLQRFERWQGAVVVVTLAALASVVAWAIASADAEGGAAVVAVAVALGAASVAAGRSLIRVPPGVLACHGGSWSFAPDVGARRSGPMTVAIDLGSFLLLRLDDAARGRIWLPVQRRGLEPDWHALRCAAYAPPPAAPAVAAPLPPE